MTVAELIAELSSYPPGYQVIVIDRDGRPVGDGCFARRGLLAEDPGGGESFVQDESETDDPGFIAISGD